MELDIITNKLDLKYYKSLEYFLTKNGIDNDKGIEWLNNNIKKLSEKIKDDKNSETLTEKNKEQSYQSLSYETENHKHFFSNEDFYKKPWVKLNPIHKILKIKEFVNNLKIDLEQDRTKLKDELVELVKTKILTKKEHVKYDEVNGKVISLTNLKYNNNKYYYNIEKY
jgi:hypothetical protein